MSAAAALRARTGHDENAADNRRIGILFAIGAALFAIASLPGASSLSRGADGVTYFIGSIFFTAAAFEQMRLADPDRAEIWASAIQLAGTFLFNVSTLNAMLDHLSGEAKDLLVWAPDAFGSICFLVSSGIAIWAVRHERSVTRREALLNMIGSIAFGASAVGAYVIPDDGKFLNATLNRLGTLWGALCFLAAAIDLARGRPALVPVM
jgi:hypothetical protein